MVERYIMDKMYKIIYKMEYTFTEEEVKEVLKDRMKLLMIKKNIL